MRASTARAAVIAGASIINDVSGGLADEAMLDTAAELKVPYIAMHWRGHSKEMNNLAVYQNVVEEVLAELSSRIEAALSAGVSKSNLIIDPGIGFAKESADNWAIIEEIEQFVALGYPVLVGASRKRFLGGDDPTSREAATVALTKRLSQSGIWAVRVHGVAANKAVL
jgi:dihydropteroate synthase